MALARPLFVGFSSASRPAREGGDLEVTVLGKTRTGARVFTLPWFFVRQVDALLERWRREAHEAVLLTMNDGVLGETLIESAWAGGLRDVTFLLARGVDVNYEHVHLFTALSRSAQGGHLPVMTVLLDAGANDLHWSLDFAAECGHTHCVALLLDRGADIHFGAEQALQDAARTGHLDTIRLLLDRGADIHARDDAALRNARRSGHEEAVALLLERGANADAHDE